LVIGNWLLVIVLVVLIAMVAGLPWLRFALPTVPFRYNISRVPNKPEQP
jgi:hypothetical protein